MSRRGDFLLAVQSFLLRREEATEVMRDVLDRAFALPEHAVPEKAATAALEFVRHAAMPIAYPKPEWLAAHEESTGAPSAVLVAVHGHPWWSHVDDSGYEHAVPADVHPFLARQRVSLLVSRANAGALVDWATTLPDWDYDEPPFVVEAPPG